MSVVISCTSVNELEKIAGKLLNTYPNGRIFAFYGQMGAGKTTFIKAICKQLEVRDTVNSPTFAIVNEYLRNDGSKIHHFDLYRLKSWEELLDIGYEDYFYSGNYCLLEWPEKIEQLLPEEAIKVSITVDPIEETRVFTF
ncbi:MAG: tRNA (adenosine(37)-N6)-threonylcarbamoyltransferase complex ATPase subunit type 1 TsaE [Bacteroidales bacterium]|nr:tRNA (adenosine(37)-N6)-threonylcarbamoyltransferase complex ATPase subunit type 1 TsaE [Bacteroidales bacterium]